MRDIHCHILPGVDDGAPDLTTSLAMVRAAESVGVTAITATSHFRDPWCDLDASWAAYGRLREAAQGFPIAMGFEVSYRTLMARGMQWAPYLHTDRSMDFLLELPPTMDATALDDAKRVIYDLQSRHLSVIIAHPERVLAIQRDHRRAAELVAMGCRLQVSASFLGQPLISRERSCASSLLHARLVTYIASDAHRPGDFQALSKAWRRYARYLRT